jgi:hypothetical protein
VYATIAQASSAERRGDGRHELSSGWVQALLGGDGADEVFSGSVRDRISS